MTDLHKTPDEISDNDDQMPMGCQIAGALIALAFAAVAVLYLL